MIVICASLESRPPAHNSRGNVVQNPTLSLILVLGHSLPSTKISEIVGFWIKTFQCNGKVVTVKVSQTDCKLVRVEKISHVAPHCQ
ncbi:hypothetical protein FKM82_031405 [Ascaphus truei]